MKVIKKRLELILSKTGQCKYCNLKGKCLSHKGIVDCDMRHNFIEVLKVIKSKRRGE